MAETTNYECATEVREAIQQLGREVFEATRDLRHDIIEAMDLQDRAALIAWQQLMRFDAEAGIDITDQSEAMQIARAHWAWKLADQFIQARQDRIDASLAEINKQ